MREAQYPWEIKVGKFASFSFEMYAKVCYYIISLEFQAKFFIIFQILKTSLSFLSVLLAVKENK